LWILAAILVSTYPLLGAGTQTIGGYKLLTIEGVLFGVMTAGIVLTLRVVGELWRPAGGSYNVDAVLSTMVSGLENELRDRMSGKKLNGSSSTLAPSAANEIQKRTSTATTSTTTSSNPMKGMEQQPGVGSSSKATTIPVDTSILPLQQGANVGVLFTRIYQWIRGRRRTSTSKTK
jgi:hypothetical protein